MGIFSRFAKKDASAIVAPASFLNPHSTLGELDLHLIAEGRHEQLWKALGAHVRRDSAGELLGTAFSVWAPNAQAVSLIGDHNYWDKNTNHMVRIGSTGIWETFIPDIGVGSKYKFAHNSVAELGDLMQRHSAKGPLVVVVEAAVH